MLTLTRKAGERIAVGDDVEITIVEVSGGKVRIGIHAPREMRIYRGEVLARVIEENRRAVPASPLPADLGAHAITFHGGLPGLEEHDAWVLAEVSDDGFLRALVSLRERAVQLLVLDAADVAAEYPLDRARRAAEHLEPALVGEETAVALVTTLPHGDERASVNLLAPIVIGLTSRRGVQVVLDGLGLPVRCELDVAGASRGTLHTAPGQAHP